MSSPGPRDSSKPPPGCMLSGSLLPSKESGGMSLGPYQQGGFKVLGCLG